MTSKWPHRVSKNRQARVSFSSLTAPSGVPSVAHDCGLAMQSWSSAAVIALILMKAFSCGSGSPALLMLKSPLVGMVSLLLQIGHNVGKFQAPSQHGHE